MGAATRSAPRRVAVLTYIAAHPGASNREIAAGAGTIDEGQLSKLLRRAESLGLVIDRRNPELAGAAREWHLTDQGESICTAARQAATAATGWTDTGAALQADLVL